MDEEFVDLNPKAIADAVQRFFGVEIAPRAADDAIARYEIGFFKLGRARFTNREELAAWIAASRVAPKPREAQPV
jgi:hypothetical protein